MGVHVWPGVPGGVWDKVEGDLRGSQESRMGLRGVPGVQAGVKGSRGIPRGLG